MDANFWDGKRGRGVPDRLAAGDERSVVDVFLRSCDKYAARPAFSSLGVTLTYGEVERLSAAFAGYLSNCTDLKPGDRIAVQLPNVLHYPIAVFGALRAGLIVVNTNPLYTAREMRHQFKDAGVRALVFLNLFGDRVAEVAADGDIEYLIEAQMGEFMPPHRRWLVHAALRYVKKLVPAYRLPQAISFRTALRQGFNMPLRTLTTCPHDVAVLQYTGGTTGVPRGAMLTHANLLANMHQVDACLKELGADEAALLSDGLETIIAPLPLYHIYAFTAHCMCMMLNGHHNVLIANPKDIDGFVRELAKWRFSGFVGINTLFDALMRHRRFASLDFSALKLTLSGGTALAPATSERWKQMTGCTAAEAYGLTECSPLVCANPLGAGVHPGTIGLAAVGTALKVVDEAGVELPLGHPGELCVQGPQVMAGYWNDTAATSQAIDADGWLRTGDIAVIDEDGYVRIVDRKKDLILVSGFNVYPRELEEVALSNPRVLNCAAIGVADPHSGEVAKLFVVPAASDVTVDELFAYCREHLTGYKVPRHIVLVDSLPMSAVGKVLRRELRERG